MADVAGATAAMAGLKTAGGPISNIDRQEAIAQQKSLEAPDRLKPVPLGEHCWAALLALLRLFWLLCPSFHVCLLPAGPADRPTLGRQRTARP